MADAEFQQHVVSNVILYDKDEVGLAVSEATALPAGTRGFISVGYDGTNTRFVRVDSGGRQVAVGAAAQGAAVAGNPILTAGYDGTNVRIPLTDTSGRQRIVGAAAAGAAPVGDPVLGAGWDGTNVQRLRTNTAGRQEHVLYDGSGNPVTVSNDAGIHRVEIAGKVSVIGASPPPATTPAVLFGDNPLSVGTHDTTFVIPSGQTFYLQEIVAGNEDPTKGAVVEVLYNNGTEHLIGRVYIAGQTLTIGYPNRSTARDGTALVGNGTWTIILRRTKYSGTNIAIDAVARGYTA